ncbi:MAG TPA: patatin-like phospholipase family protein [Anaeromyxobacteraceae bacterium]|nr:patatin-like phospholipase family protein [Anaeromyxobacteraceae bacterium]
MERRLLFVALLSAAACRTVPVAAPPPPPPPPPRPLVAAHAPVPRVALVLGGGAARGFAHVGVLRALEQEKIPIDLVVGTSVGSLIGALYAADRNSFELEWTAFQLEKEDLFDYGVMNVVTGMSFAAGDRLERWLTEKVRVKNIEDMKVPFAAVATDLNWGSKVVIDRGPVARAVRASSAIPGVFPPVQHMGKILVDGGVSDNIPISVARQKGADLVVAVDISEDLGNTNIKNVVDVVLQATNIMFALNVEHSKRGADVLVTPKIGDVGMLDFTQKKRCMQAGIDAGRAAIPTIRKAIEEWQARKVAGGAAAAPRG